MLALSEENGELVGDGNVDVVEVFAISEFADEVDSDTARARESSECDFAREVICEILGEFACVFCVANCALDFFGGHLRSLSVAVDRNPFADGSPIGAILELCGNRVEHLRDVGDSVVLNCVEVKHAALGVFESAADNWLALGRSHFIQRRVKRIGNRQVACAFVTSENVRPDFRNDVVEFDCHFHDPFGERVWWSDPKLAH